MNEEQKNIEKCLSEQVGAEIVNAATSDKFDALVTEAWTGERPAQPYTSWIVEFKSLLILLLRKLYYTPLSLFNNTSIKDFITSLQATIVTLQAAITSMLGDIAASYQKVGEKGGTLPDQQTSANLPAAIESIPSGGKIYVTDFSNLSSFWRGFTGTDAGEQYLDFTYRTSGLNLTNLFVGAGNIRKVDLRNWECTVVQFYQAFKEMSLCESIVFGENIDTSNCDWGNAFYGFGRDAESSMIDLRGVSVNLVDTATFANTNGVKSLRVDNGFKASVVLVSIGLDRQGYIVFFNDLATLPEGTSYTIRIKASVYDTLSDDDKAIATSKGWILQRG